MPQGHKVALVDLPAGAPVLRYNVVIGYALQATSRPAAGCTSACCEMPDGARARRPADRHRQAARRWPPLEGYTFEGYRNADGSVGTRNILAITTTVQCVAGVRRVRGAAHQGRAAAALSRTSTTWSGSSTPTAAAWRSTRPTPIIPIRTLRNISLNPNFGGEVMVVSLGCEKLQPERLLPPGQLRDRR